MSRAVDVGVRTSPATYFLPVRLTFIPPRHKPHPACLLARHVRNALPCLPFQSTIVGNDYTVIYFPSLYNDEHLNTLVGDESYQKALRAFGGGWAKVWDARSLIYRYQATRDHDVGQPFGGHALQALGKIKARTLIMPGMTDRTLPSYMGQEIYRGVKNSVYV